MQPLACALIFGAIAFAQKFDKNGESGPVSNWNEKSRPEGRLVRAA
jgi:hypothetical protein